MRRETETRGKQVEQEGPARGGSTLIDTLRDADDAQLRRFARVSVE